MHRSFCLSTVALFAFLTIADSKADNGCVYLHMRTCIAGCLELLQPSPSKQCSFNYTSGGFVNDSCNGRFEQNWAVKKKVIACNVDADNEEELKSLVPVLQNNLCTHILMGSWFKFNSEKLEFTTRYSLNSEFAMAKREAQRLGVKVVLTVGSEHGAMDVDAANFSWISNNLQLRKEFTSKLLHVVEANDFDGVDIRWSFAACPKGNCDKGDKNDKEGLVSLIKALRDRLNIRNNSRESTKDGLIFLMLPKYEAMLPFGYDLITLSTLVHYFYVPTFMYNNASVHVLQFGSTGRLIINILETLKQNLVKSMHKLLMGHTALVPTYVLSASQNVPTAGLEVVNAPKYLNWGETCLKIKQNNFSITEDKATQYYAHNTREVVVYDSFGSLKIKIGYYKQSGAQVGIGGMFFSHLFKDDANNVCGCGVMPQLRMMAELINGAGCTLRDCP